jgi:hypothetical protein
MAEASAWPSCVLQTAFTRASTQQSTAAAAHSQGDDVVVAHSPLVDGIFGQAQNRVNLPLVYSEACEACACCTRDDDPAQRHGRRRRQCYRLPQCSRCPFVRHMLVVSWHVARCMFNDAGYVLATAPHTRK